MLVGYVSDERYVALADALVEFERDGEMVAVVRSTPRGTSSRRSRRGTTERRSLNRVSAARVCIWRWWRASHISFGSCRIPSAATLGRNGPARASGRNSGFTPWRRIS